MHSGWLCTVTQITRLSFFANPNPILPQSAKEENPDNYLYMFVWMCDVMSAHNSACENAPKSRVVSSFRPFVRMKDEGLM